MGKDSRRLHDPGAAAEDPADALAAGHLPRRLADSAADRRPDEDDAVFGEQSGRLGDLLEQVAVFSASQLNQATIFGLGIMPYISASIIFQLLGSVYPPLEKLQKEGESGPQEDQRIHPLRHGRACAWAKAGSTCGVHRSRSGLIYEQFLTSTAAAVRLAD